MGSAILLISPVKQHFNFMVKENISVFMAELFPILVILMLISNSSQVKINTDSNIIYTNYNKWKELSIKQLVKEKISYKVHWILLFKLINFRKIEFYLNKVVAHADNIYNNEVNKLAKNSYKSANICSLNNDILTHQGTILWHQEIIIQDILLMVNQIYLSKYLKEYIYKNKNIKLRNHSIADIDLELYI
jgi:ribonuclease HI